MKNFLNKPITWGGYLKFTGIMIIAGILYMIPYLRWVRKLFGFNLKDCLPESWRKSKKEV